MFIWILSQAFRSACKTSYPYGHDFLVGCATPPHRCLCGHSVGDHVRLDNQVASMYFASSISADASASMYQQLYDYAIPEYFSVLGASGRLSTIYT